MDTNDKPAVGSNAELGPIEALRFFCSQHLQADAWLDVEPLFAAVVADRASAVAAERERCEIALREWAVSRWRAEVEHRPLANRTRRTLDDTWRQVMRYAGLDPSEAVGPSHDELLASRDA